MAGWVILPWLAMIFAPTPAVAVFFTGNDILARCQSSELNVWADCLGYVSAIADTLAGGNTISGYRACPSRNVTRGQVRDVVVSWLIANPASRHFTANSVTAAALSVAFPCSTSSPPRPKRQPPSTSSNPFERQ